MPQVYRSKASTEQLATLSKTFQSMALSKDWAPRLRSQWAAMSDALDELIGRRTEEVVGAELRSLERSIAYSSAQSVIDCGTAMVSESDAEERLVSELHNLGDIDEFAADEITDAVRYLESRGLIQRHEKNPNWIWILEESEADDIRLATTHDAPAQENAR